MIDQERLVYFNAALLSLLGGSIERTRTYLSRAGLPVAASMLTVGVIADVADMILEEAERAGLIGEMPQKGEP